MSITRSTGDHKRHSHQSQTAPVEVSVSLALQIKSVLQLLPRLALGPEVGKGKGAPDAVRGYEEIPLHRLAQLLEEAQSEELDAAGKLRFGKLYLLAREAPVDLAATHGYQRRTHGHRHHNAPRIHLAAEQGRLFI